MAVVTAAEMFTMDTTGIILVSSIVVILIVVIIAAAFAIHWRMRENRLDAKSEARKNARSDLYKIE